MHAMKTKEKKTFSSNRSYKPVPFNRFYFLWLQKMIYAWNKRTSLNIGSKHTFWKKGIVDLNFHFHCQSRNLKLIHRINVFQKHSISVWTVIVSVALRFSTLHQLTCACCFWFCSCSPARLTGYKIIVSVWFSNYANKLNSSQCSL